MKYLILAFACIIITCASFSQLSTSTYGGNKRAWTGERVGLTDISITYDRPGVKGRDGKIWGTLVPEGFFKPDFGPEKATPWRAGANENTTISFSNNVKIEGKMLPAGTYGFFIAYGPEKSTVIFSKNSTSWGSYFYDEKEDALRVDVKPIPVNESSEWLKYEFVNETDSSATIRLVWEKLSIPFTVSVDLSKDQIASFRKELRGEKGFSWQAFDQAAQWCAQHNVNIEEALLWADSATGPIFGGGNQFKPWTTKAQLLTLAGKDNEATAVMKNALPLANMMELHQYGRQLISAKRNKEALDVFKLNLSKNPKQFTSLMGMARGYSANGDYKNALKYAQLAVTMAPDPGNKTNVESAIIKLKEGKDIN